MDYLFNQGLGSACLVQYRILMLDADFLQTKKMLPFLLIRCRHRKWLLPFAKLFLKTAKGIQEFRHILSATVVNLRY
jgi:hypothetical protein